MFVSGVATQGSKFYDCWVRSYKLLYHGYGEVWIKYTEADIEQVRTRIDMLAAILKRFLISSCMILCYLSVTHGRLDFCQLVCTGLEQNT